MDEASGGPCEPGARVVRKEHQVSEETGVVVLAVSTTFDGSTHED